MSRQHIVLLHHVSDQGGGTKSLIDIAVMLKDKYKVTICLPKGSGETIGIAKKFDITCYEMLSKIPALNVFSGGPAFFSKSFITGLIKFKHIEALSNELMKLEPQILIFNSIVTSLIARKIPDTVRKICFIRETLVPSVFNRLLKGTFENYIDGVAYIAEHEKRVFNLKKPIQVVIPDTLDPSSIECFSQEEAVSFFAFDSSKFYILYMGGSARLKGFDTMLDTMSHLNDNYCAIIVGNIQYKFFTWKNILLHIYNIRYALFLVRCKRLLKKLREDSRVKFLGYQKEISKIMCASDVIVFPSSKPHQPRPCIEAGMYSKPVILSDFEATSEFFVDGYNALVFKPKNGKDMADKIEMLNNNIELRKQIGENNYEMSYKKHNFVTIQEETLEFINKIVSIEK